MKCKVTSVQIIYEDNRVSSHYRLFDGADNEISRGVRDTTLSQSAQDTVLAETQAELDADIAGLAPAPDAKPQVVTDAMNAIGAARSQVEAAKRQLSDINEQIAAKQAEFATAVATAPAKVTP